MALFLDFLSNCSLSFDDMTQNAKDLLSNLVAATSKKLMVPQHHNSIKGELKYKKEADTNIKKEDMHLYSDKRVYKMGTVRSLASGGKASLL